MAGQIEDHDLDDLEPPITEAEIIDAKTGKKFVCAITGKERNKRELIALDALRPALSDRIRDDYPDLEDTALIDRRLLNRYRTLYVEELLREETGEFSELDRQVSESITGQAQIMAAHVDDEYEEARSFADKLSDGLAEFGGSWAFLISFFCILLLWISVNVILGQSRAFDAYPFVFLNLVLSCIAAVQAPVIMMSQKRQESKDRLRSLNDYKVNLRAELEIRHLHEKLDYLITRQWQRLAEIQQIQLEIMQDLRRKR